MQDTLTDYIHFCKISDRNIRNEFSTHVYLRNQNISRGNNLPNSMLDFTV